MDAIQYGASPRHERSPFTPVGARIWTIAAAAVVVVASAIYWTAVRNHPSPNQNAAVKQHTVPAIVPAPEIPTEASKALPPAERSIPKETAKARRMIREEKPVSSDEMAVGNHPAPEAPLTEQERLLLRFVHRADPQQLEALSPVLRSAQDAEEKAQFQRFFEPPTTTDNE